MRKRFCCLVLVLAMAAAMVPMRVSAVGNGAVCLNPAELRPEGGAWDLGGSVVYFGEFCGAPLPYRVLCTPETQTLTEESLLLDCGTILKRKAFDSNFKRNEGQEKLPSEWKGSDLEIWLNGNNFYESRGVFTHLERSAIAQTTLADARIPYSTSHWENMYRDFGSTDHVFLLSAAEVTGLYAQEAASAKDGETTDWWVRSAFDMGGNGAGSVHFDGHVCNNSVSNFVVGVSPALNVKLSAVVLVSAANGDKAVPLAKAAGQPDNNEWKLTLLDPGKTVTVTGDVTRDGNTVTVPYICEGRNITQISLVITDGAGTVLYYGATQNGTFSLPKELAWKTCGLDYHAYLLAEDVNGAYRTDYASPLCEITIPNP